MNLIKHRKFLQLLSLLVIIICSLLFLINDVDAKRGCCSWHGGVSHCDSSVGRYVCNDGTYSPSCTCGVINPVPIPSPTTLEPTTTTTKPTTTTIIGITPAAVLETEIQEKNLGIEEELEFSASEKLMAQVHKENIGISAWWWIIGIGAISYLFVYKFKK